MEDCVYKGFKVEIRYDSTARRKLYYFAKIRSLDGVALINITKNHKLPSEAKRDAESIIDNRLGG